jgi:GT2 family glycosyltransferase
MEVRSVRPNQPDIAGDSVARIAGEPLSGSGEDVARAAALSRPGADASSVLSYFSPRRADCRRLQRRLDIERGLFDGGVLAGLATGTASVLALVVLVDEEPGEELARTLRAWRLQSCPFAAAAVMARDGRAAEAIHAFCSTTPDLADTRVLSAEAPDWAWLRQAQFVAFARPGDILHPSLVAAVAKASVTDGVDLLIWNELLARGAGPDPRKVVRLRRPELERLTLLSSNYIGLAFAVRTELLADYPGDGFTAIAATNGHLFHLWLLTRADCRWHTHPEYLSRRVVPQNGPLLLGGVAVLPEHAELLAAVAPELALQPHTMAHASPRFVPRWRAKRISVIIPFRDEAERTCRCLRSVARQQTSGEIEVLLINNQSQRSTLMAIEACLVKLQPRFSWQIIDYDRPFNHSRQTNLGAASATGDVLVFLNNDAEIESAEVLEETAAWALLPGVATAGARILDWQNGLVCAGVRVRRRDDGMAGSPVVESRDAAFAGIVRETPINTFAFAALSRETFQRLGALDEVLFPNGYNDVDYCLRARRAGFTHVYLGHLIVRHVPGTSRGKPNETYQHLALQLRYPELTRLGLLQLEEDRSSTWEHRVIERCRRSWSRLRRKLRF